MKCRFDMSDASFSGCAQGLSDFHLKACPGTCSMDTRDPADRPAATQQEETGSHKAMLRRMCVLVKRETPTQEAAVFPLRRKDHPDEGRLYPATGGYQGSTTAKPGRYGPDTPRYCDGCGGWFEALRWCTDARWCPVCREKYRTSAQRVKRARERWEAGEPLTFLGSRSVKK